MPVVGNAVGVAHLLLLKTADLRDDADHVIVDSIGLFAFLLFACFVLGHLLEENRWMNESAITALLLVSRGESFACEFRAVPQLLNAVGSASRCQLGYVESRFSINADVQDPSFHLLKCEGTLYRSYPFDFKPRSKLACSEIRRGAFLMYLLPPIIFILQYRVFTFVGLNGEADCLDCISSGRTCFCTVVTFITLAGCRFSVKKKQFFENFIAIMLFLVVGDFISFAIISTCMKANIRKRTVFSEGWNLLFRFCLCHEGSMFMEKKRSL